MKNQTGNNTMEDSTAAQSADPKNFLMSVKLGNHAIPQFVESASPNKPWVFYGEKNDYPTYLVNLFNRSPQHNAIITGKRDFIFGQGFSINKAACATADLEALVAKRLSHANCYEKLNDVMSRCVLDLEIAGGFCLQIIYKKVLRKNVPGIIAEIYHIDFTKIRSNKDNTTFYYSEDWSQFNQSLEKTGLKEFKPFDPTNPKEGTQLLYFKEYRPKLSTYSLPDYIGCIPYVECDYEISNFHLNNIKNSF